MSGKWEDNELQINRVKRNEKQLKLKRQVFNATWDLSRLGKREINKQTGEQKGACTPSTAGSFWTAEALGTRRKIVLLKRTRRQKACAVNEMTGVIVGGKGQDKVSARLESIDAAPCYELWLVTFFLFFFYSYCSNQYAKWLRCSEIKSGVTHVIARVNKCRLLKSFYSLIWGENDRASVLSHQTRTSDITCIHFLAAFLSDIPILLSSGQQKEKEKKKKTEYPSNLTCL